MTQALQLAQQAGQLGEVPVGAVVVVGGEVVGRGYNRREVDSDPLSHAELKAIAEASAKLKSWRLSDATLYVTLEPCTMCAGALIQARLGRLVFGAMDPKAGAVGSLYNLLEDKRLNHQVEVTRGVLEVECGAILKDFFVALRERKKQKA
jgi:tRNA(adenine34) deaminase